MRLRLVALFLFICTFAWSVPTVSAATTTAQVLFQYTNASEPYDTLYGSNLGFNSQRYLVATGTLSYFVAPVASSGGLTGSERFSVRLFNNYFSQWVDCQTPTKTADEWGISRIARDPHAPLVSFGPFSGSNCLIDDDKGGYQSISIFVRVGESPTHASVGAMGSSAVLGFNFTAYGSSMSPVVPPDPCIATNTCASNVLFLPGIESSRLYRPDYSGGTDKLWEPSSDADASDLSMTNTGGSTRSDIYTKDVMDEAYGTFNIYKSFMADMDALKTKKTIADWEAIPYDWRLSLDDILNYGSKFPDGRLYYSGDLRATSTPYVIQELRRLAASSKTGKVTIIAHSNGGLVAKALMQKLGDTEAGKLIDKVIFVASPQVGTPSAIGALLHGYDQNIPLMLSDAAARSVSQNMPGVYNLLPSSNYFMYVKNPVITFDQATLPDWAAKYGGLIHSTERLRSFMTDAARTKPAYDDDDVTPEINNVQLFDAAQGVHALLDAWTPPQGVKIIQIAGWGNETLSGVTYRKVRTCVPGTSLCTAYKLTFSPEHIIDGDGTVVAPSALWISMTTGAMNYWVNLDDYNIPFIRHITHRDILEIPQLRTFVTNLLTSTTTTPLPQYLSATQPAYSGSGDRLHFTLHSPLTLGFMDASGGYTGATATSTASAVSGVVYERYGDVQWLSVPANLSGQVVMHGTGSGSFTLDAERASGSMTVATTSFEGIPSATSTVATIDIDPSRSVTASSTLVVDENGDGTTDMVLKAREGATVTLDTTPPVTSIAVSGTKGKNGWYTSAVQITLDATDVESGVASTYFSLDGAATTTGTKTAITTDGRHTISYYSIDTAGNIEQATSTVIKIDTVAPEMRITFDAFKDALAYIGFDAMSSTTVTAATTYPAPRKNQKTYQGTATTTVVAADEAGNTTRLVYTERLPSPVQHDMIALQEIAYNGATTTVASTTLSYKWRQSKEGTYKLFASYLQMLATSTESHYRSKQDATIIMTKPRELDDEGSDDGADVRPIRQVLPGMVVPYLSTDKGSLRVNY